MAKVKSVKNVANPPQTLSHQGFRDRYEYHNMFRSVVCKVLAGPVRAELQRNKMTLKALSDMMCGLGYSYSYDGLRQALIGKNYHSVDLSYWAKIYYHLGLELPSIEYLNSCES
jgi:hypothetical protein